jgi:hypothetical protein
MEDWSPEPAGAHGRVLQQGDKLMYNGREIKLWGINITYNRCAPEKEIADRASAFYRKYGINTIRFHLYTQDYGWGGIQSERSCTKADPAKLDRMDYYAGKLRENGVYIKLSHSNSIVLGADDFDRIPYLDEFGEPKNGRMKVGGGALWFSRELQDLRIEQIVGLLRHTNPYTGVRWADEPALFCIEIVNENDVFWLYNDHLLEKPTLRNRTAARFSEWLRRRYSTDEAWRKAWGEEAIVKDPKAPMNRALAGLLKPSGWQRVAELRGEVKPESPAAGTVIPWGNRFAMGDVGGVGERKEARVVRQRLIDTMGFLVELQDEFYARFARAVRDAGYKGEMVGSNWMAGKGMPHFHNLRSDWKVGVVDRHNYIGGTRAMVDLPGTELISSGLMQVVDAPFMLSEWIHVFPNEWYAEGPAITGAYGMGLNGWDVSYIFMCRNDDQSIFSPALGAPWDATTPMILGTFPAVSRFVRRMDVRQAVTPATLNVCVPAFAGGRLGVDLKEEARYDFKSYSSTEIPNTALAVTRVAVKFTDTYQDTPKFDFAPYMDGPTYVSKTKQLRWTPAPEGRSRAGYFTMNTPATRAFVGFGDGVKAFDLGGVKLSPGKGFSAIYVTARSVSAKRIEDEKEILVVAMARGRNTGMKWNADETKVEDKGSGPIVLEPVKASITVPGAVSVKLLDHDGRATEQTIAVEAGAFTIDGGRDRTPYYLITRE